MLLPHNGRNPSPIMVQRFETRGEDLLVQIINLQAIPGESVLVRLVEGALCVQWMVSAVPCSLEAENYAVDLGFCFAQDIFRGNMFQSVLLCSHTLRGGLRLFLPL